MSRVSVRNPALVRVVFTGQSMLMIPPSPDNLSDRVMAGRGIPWHNDAHAGLGWGDMLASAEHPGHITGQARNRAGCTDVLIMCGGQGDAINPGPMGQQTAAVCFSRAQAVAAHARSVGFDHIIACTYPSIGPLFGRPTVSEAAALDGHNALMRADTVTFDAIADLGAVLDDATDTAYFLVDRVHLTAAGAQLAADTIAPILDALLATL